MEMFTADEFSLLLNGVCNIDVEDWKRNTQVSLFSVRIQFCSTAVQYRIFVFIILLGEG